ncbi:MAG TPA: metal ABC transporter substrate-binding protein [Syntrophorhabdaceae bacterium]|nr:metal ABC transporter substrate-binding protein [Syntrophorhabdaceae bacterium]
MKTKRACTIGLLCAAFLLCFCHSRESENLQGKKPPVVVATLFTVYDFARHIADGRANVTLLLPPGVEAHSFEPKPGDMLKIADADLFLYTGKYMEPWVESVLRGADNKKLLVVDTSSGITLMQDSQEFGERHSPDAYDPHIWLDFTNAQKMVDNILKGLVQIDPENGDFYTQNAGAYKAQLEDMDKEYKDGLSNCKRDTFVHGGHFAFNYLAHRYHLHYVSAYAGSPNAEPSPKKMIELKKMIERDNVRYIYYEELITPRVAEVLARETGVKLLKLSGAHNISKEELADGKTFIDLMKENLKNLEVGLQCR